MKKILAVVLATVMVAGAAAPSFADTSGDNCSFKDKTLCVTQSLVDVNNG